MCSPLSLCPLQPHLLILLKLMGSVLLLLRDPLLIGPLIQEIDVVRPLHGIVFTVPIIALALHLAHVVGYAIEVLVLDVLRCAHPFKHSLAHYRPSMGYFIDEDLYVGYVTARVVYLILHQMCWNVAKGIGVSEEPFLSLHINIEDSSGL